MSTVPVAIPLCNYYTVNDSSPATQWWDLAAGAFVPLADATANSWLSQLNGAPVGSPYYPYNLQMLSAASSDAGTTTTFAVNNTSILTTGAKYNFSATGGLYDGNFAITVVDGTHVKIAQAFVGNATGQMSGASIIDTIAHLLAIIDAQNQTITPPPYLAVSSGVNYQMANTPPLIFDFTPTAGGLTVTLPQMNVPGSLAKGKLLLIHNAGSVPFTLKDFGAFLVDTVQPLGFLEVYLTNNNTQAGTTTAIRILRTARTVTGNSDTTLSFSSFSLMQAFVTSAALTVPRTWTLPAANSTFGGSYALVADEAGGVTSTNTLSVARAGADTINGGAASIVLNRARDWVLLETDGVSNWTIVGGKGSLASTDLSDLPIPVASGGTGNTTGQPSGTAGGDLSGTYPNPTVAKFNGHATVQVADGGTNYTGSAWTAFTSTLVPDVGTINQGTNQSGYLQIGKIVFVNIHETVSSVSGAPTQMGVTLPVACKRVLGIWGIELSSPDIAGTFWSANTTVSFRLRNSGGTSIQPLANKEIALTFSYEAA